MIDVEYNGVKATSCRAVLKELPSIPAPEPNFTEYEVAGKDGTIQVKDGTYKNIEIPLKFNFISHKDLWHETYRAIKKWVFSDGNGMLRFSDDAGYFYKVKRTKINTTERNSIRVGNVETVFTCEPYEYLMIGKEFLPPEDVSFNPYELSHPEYKITGEGNCTLTVNGKTMKANIGQNLTIDTDRMIAYKEDGDIINTSVTGNYDDLYLKPGENIISVSSGFSLTVKPNWRCR